MKRFLAFCHHIWNRFRGWWILGLVVFSCILVILVVPFVYTFVSTRNNRYDLERVPADAVPYHEVAIVFGAGIQPNGQPTPYLQDRLTTAANLYKAHRVKIILMSGDNSTRKHDEPTVMRNYAIKLGVPANAIREDYAGYNTYDTCYRAHYIFGLSDATLVTQGYHLPRALVTCKGLGVHDTGVIAIHSARDYTIPYILREFVSTDKMIVQLIFKPSPTVLGKPLPISNPQS